MPSNEPAQTLPMKTQLLGGVCLNRIGKDQGFGARIHQLLQSSRRNWSYLTRTETGIAMLAMRFRTLQFVSSRSVATVVRLTGQYRVGWDAVHGRHRGEAWSV